MRGCPRRAKALRGAFFVRKEIFYRLYMRNECCIVSARNIFFRECYKCWFRYFYYITIGFKGDYNDAVKNKGEENKHENFFGGR